MMIGAIEIIPRTPDAELVLKVSLCPKCAEFLEFSFNSSTQTAEVRTKKPLDTEALAEVRQHIFQCRLYFGMMVMFFELIFQFNNDYY